MVLNWFNHKNKLQKLDYNNLPTHIAIIMDGNGRWAKKRGLSSKAGHSAGATALKRTLHSAAKFGIKYVTVYAFSTENWNRPSDEVNALMELLLRYLKNAEKELDGENARIKIIGDKSRFSREIREEIKRVELNTKKNDQLFVNIALNYGGRSELVYAIRKIAKKAAEGKLEINNINEKTITDHLYTASIPDPDLIIRTSAEFRLSNFLLWQSAYSEFYFTKTLWPDFGENDLYLAILQYQQRNRRYGGR